MRIKYIIYSVLFALLLGSCSKEDIEIKGPAKRTVLAYMIASTNLGSDIRANIRQMMTVASNKALNGGNLVVYYSESKSRSYLFQIKEDKKGNIVTDTVRFYENQSAILPETMYKGDQRNNRIVSSRKLWSGIIQPWHIRGCQVISVLYVLSEKKTANIWK